MHVQFFFHTKYSRLHFNASSKLLSRVRLQTVGSFNTSFSYMKLFVTDKLHPFRVSTHNAMSWYHDQVQVIGSYASQNVIVPGDQGQWNTEMPRKKLEAAATFPNKRYLNLWLNERLVLHMLGGERVEILHLLVQRIVSVLEGLIDSPTSLHQSSTIDSINFNLSDSVCRKIPEAAMTTSSA